MLTAPTTGIPPAPLLVRYIRAHLRHGERAKARAEQTTKKSEAHYVTAGYWLATAKSHYGQTWEAWSAFLARVGVSQGRASELMQVANGRKDLLSLRAATAKRVRQHRARASLQSNVTKRSPPSLPEPENVTPTALHAPASAPVTPTKDPDRQLVDNANAIIDALVDTRPEVIATVARLLIRGHGKASLRQLPQSWAISIECWRGLGDDPTPPTSVLLVQLRRQAPPRDRASRPACRRCRD